MYLILILSLCSLFSTTNACTGFGDENEYIEDPMFTATISPPVGWTFFPTTATETTPYYFVGQSNNSQIAKQRAEAEIHSAMLDALVAANMQVYGVVITNDYTPTEVSQLSGTLTCGTVGHVYGKVEGGALTMTGPCTTIGQTPTMNSFSVIVKIMVQNAANVKYQWNIVKNTFMQKLALNYNARFVGEVQLSKN